MNTTFTKFEESVLERLGWIGAHRLKGWRQGEIVAELMGHAGSLYARHGELDEYPEILDFRVYLGEEGRESKKSLIKRIDRWYFDLKLPIDGVSPTWEITNS